MLVVGVLSFYRKANLNTKSSKVYWYFYSFHYQITIQLQCEDFLVSYNYFHQSGRTEVILVLFMGVPGVQSLAAPQGMVKSKTKTNATLFLRNSTMNIQ